MAELGRPTKLSVEIINKLKQAFAIGATVEEACFYAEIDKGTYYNWIKNNDALFHEFERLKQKPILEARQEVVKGLKGNPEFALKFLERKKKDEFSLRTELTGTTNEPIKFILEYADPKDKIHSSIPEDTTKEGETNNPESGRE